MFVWGKSRTIFFPSNTLIYGISRDGSKNFNIRTCEHMIPGQLRMGARQAKNAPLCIGFVFAFCLFIISSLQSHNAKGEKSSNSVACRLFWDIFARRPLWDIPQQGTLVCRRYNFALFCVLSNFYKQVTSTNFYCCVCNRTEFIENHQAGQCRRFS